MNDNSDRVLIGRQKELAWLRAKLEEGAPLITVVGPPGVGKSRLLEELGQPICRLADTATDDVDSIVSRTFGSFPNGLIVFDEADGVAEYVRKLVPIYFAHSPELQMVIGSRERLNVEEESVLSLAPFEREDARALWCAATQQQTDAGPDVDRLLDALGGLPLAIVLAAARWPILTPSELERRTPGVLGGLRQALDRSWDHLKDDERAAFMNLSVFRGGFTTESAEALLPANGLDLLQALFRKSLLEARPHGTSSRILLLQPLRELAAERLRATGFEEAVRQSHEDLYFRLLAEKEAAIDRDGLEVTTRWFRDEAQNVLAAIDHAIARNAMERAARMAISASAVGLWSGVRRDIVQRLKTIREAALSNDLAVAVLLAFASIGPSGDARQVALEAALARSPNDTRAQIALLPVLADAGRIEEAERMLRHASANVHDPLLESELERKRASIPHAQQKLDEAIGHARRALEIARQMKSPRMEYPALVTLSFLSGEAGDSSRALRYFTQASELLGTTSELDATLLASQGYAHHAKGEWTEARRSYAQALERLPRTGQLTWLLRGYAALASFQEDHVDPRSTLEIVEMELRHVAMAHALLFQGYLLAVETLYGERKSIAASTALERSPHLTKVRLRALEICSMKDVPDDPALDVGIEISVARDLVRRIRAKETPKPVIKPVRVAKDGAWFEVDGNRLSCAGRPVMKRMLAALATQTEPLSTDALVGKTWPGERILRDPARNRIRVMIARLRDLGLRAALTGTDAGYVLEAERVAPQ